MGHAMGGFREAPSVTLGAGSMPRVAQVAGAAAPPDPAALGQDNQLGVGAIGTQPAPTGAGAGSPLPAPVFRPAPATNLQPAAPPMAGGPPVRDDWRTTPGAAPQAMAPTQVMRSGLGLGSRTADDLERELLAEGWSIQDVQAARRRAEARAGVGMPV
jgi:hypothetical protein